MLSAPGSHATGLWPSATGGDLPHSTTSNSGGVRLLPADALVKTGTIDHAEWNYRPVLGWIQRLRFKLVASLLPKRLVPKLLEVGYGSGIFMPQLSVHCEELYGIDPHGMPEEVAGVLASYGVRAKLFSGSAEWLPLEDQSFDCIVAVSSLEFIPDIAVAAREMARILKPEGQLIMVTPGHSGLLDCALKVLTGECAERDYGRRREGLMPGLLQYFVIARKRSFPSVAPAKGLYTAFSLRKHRTACPGQTLDVEPVPAGIALAQTVAMGSPVARGLASPLALLT